MGVIDQLREMREFGGKPRTTGLDDATIERFASSHPALLQAIEEAVARHRELRNDLSDFLKLDEVEQLETAQASFVNFYPDVDALLAWMVSSSFGNFLANASEVDRSRLRDALGRLLEPKRLDGEGIRLESYLIFATAQKPKID